MVDPAINHASKRGPTLRYSTSGLSAESEHPHSSIPPLAKPLKSGAARHGCSRRVGESANSLIKAFPSQLAATSDRSRRHGQQQRVREDRRSSASLVKV
jgi:hypothetical protein